MSIGFTRVFLSMLSGYKPARGDRPFRKAIKHGLPLVAHNGN